MRSGPAPILPQGQTQSEIVDETATPSPRARSAHHPQQPHRSTRPLWMSVFIFSVICSTLAWEGKEGKLRGGQARDSAASGRRRGQDAKTPYLKMEPADTH